MRMGGKVLRKGGAAPAGAGAPAGRWRLAAATLPGQSAERGGRLSTSVSTAEGKTGEVAGKASTATAPRLPQNARSGRGGGCAHSHRWTPGAGGRRALPARPGPSAAAAGQPRSHGPGWRASCGQDPGARALVRGKDRNGASGGTLPHRLYMAKFLTELLGCTLPRKGASPMFESKSHSRVGLKSSTKQKGLSGEYHTNNWKREYNWLIGCHVLTSFKSIYIAFAMEWFHCQ
ncbi:uncharacterized protein LOC117084896 [Trachypithecus francoisi]|uniref:uncharacterized protein LOC117084896 n=1 Tax=Trachypithecus francoisi TaxID=54180 RepID=UPI00141B1AB3|nr:uncharacterized protein LOC117084896 [Trachypithecus francoisi]